MFLSFTPTVKEATISRSEKNVGTLSVRFNYVKVCSSTTNHLLILYIIVLLYQLADVLGPGCENTRGRSAVALHKCHEDLSTS